MKILTPKTDIWGYCPTIIDDAITWIERAGRVCYRSEDKIIEGSGRKFVDGIVRRKHFSVIEHSNMVIRSKNKFPNPKKALDKANAICPSSFIKSVVHKDFIYTGGNFRAWMEHLDIATIDDLFEFHGDFIVTDQNEIPEELKMLTVHFLTDRGVTHELVRHRPCAFSQESTRYCTYKKYLEVILPEHYNDIPTTKNAALMSQYNEWVHGMEMAEVTYKQLLSIGERAEQARNVLPNSLAARIVVTASIPEWEHIIMLRTSKAAHPAIRNIVQPVADYIKSLPS